MTLLATRDVVPTHPALPDTLRLEVTRLDIHFGIRESGNTCPIACALRRALGALGLDVMTVDVEGRRADFVLRGEERWTRYSHSAAQFIRAFDAGEHVEPQTIVLERVAL